jgi:uncharacterized cupredoxin-like copper-binding protein
MLCLLALGLAAGCSPRDSGSPKAAESRPAASSDATGSEGQTVVVTATDYAFEAPASIPAGMTTFRLVNRGKELHHLVLIKIPADKTFEDMERESKHEMPPVWAELSGGPNAIDPGSQTELTQIIEPGRYVLVCFVPGVDGKPHMMRGMHQIMEVTGPAAAAALPSAADITLKLADYSFTTSQPLAAGTHVIEIENAGPQPHELVLVRLAPGKSLPDFLTWVMKPAGPPPGSAIGGVSPMVSGRRARMKVDFTPGDYALICFIPDAKDGKPHLAHGMAQQIHVK